MAGPKNYKAVDSPLKGHGAKYYQRRWILSHFPPRDQYLTLFEPYALTAAVTLAHDPEGKSEVINDVNRWVTNFWQVLQSPETSAEFIRRMSVTPFSQEEWETARAVVESRPAALLNVTDACFYFVFARQSLAGREDSFASISTSRVRRGMNEQVAAWLSCVDRLPEVRNRVLRWLVLNDDATKLTRKFDKPGVVGYFDPTYMPDSRVSPDVYRHEMTPEQHEGFLDALVGLKHMKALVSHYPHPLYDAKLKGWRADDIEIDNKASNKRVKDKEIERLYMNF